MLQLEADGPELLCVLDPRALDHPDGRGLALAPDHEEGRAARPVEAVVDEEALLPGAAVARVEVVELLLEPLVGGQVMGGAEQARGRDEGVLALEALQVPGGRERSSVSRREGIV